MIAVKICNKFKICYELYFVTERFWKKNLIDLNQKCCREFRQTSLEALLFDFYLNSVVKGASLQELRFLSFAI